jgi:hypothetical protein
MIAGHGLDRNWINAKKKKNISKWKRKEYGTAPVAIKLLKQRLNDTQGSEDPRAEGERQKLQQELESLLHKEDVR